MGMQSKRKKNETRPKFSVGDQVRVKRGVMDYEYPDLPIGGWAGVVEKIYDELPPNYLIRWNEQTLDALPPIYKKRCDRDDLDYEVMGLGDEDLEHDQGGPLEIEQPANIVTRPLNMKNEDDRIRAVFQLTSDDPLPEVDFETLAAYRNYLMEQLTFPFEANWESESGPLSSKIQKVTVIGLGDPDENFRIDDMYGLICEIKLDKKRGDVPLGELEAKKGNGNRQLVEDYCSWFWNNR